MDKDVLEDWLGEGLSLETIAQLADRHPSTVGYWIAKHGLVAVGRERHAPRGGLERDVLVGLVEDGLTVREIARLVDRSVGTVRHWLREYDLRTRRARRADPGRSLGERFSASCERHGETEFVVRNDGSPRCLECRAEAVTARRRRVKAQLVLEAGGRCAICGYDRHPAALHFHHVDPAEKRFAIAAAGVTRSLDRARSEAVKCVLLCANCHAEIESGAAELPPSILAARLAHPRSLVPG